MVRNEIDITESQFVMHIGLYARQVGTDRVAGWIREGRENLTRDLGRTPLRVELVHEIQNTYFIYQLRNSFSTAENVYANNF